MPVSPRHAALVSLLAVLACTPAEPSRTEPSPQPAVPATAAPTPITPTPATPTPAPATTTPVTAPAEPSPLRVVAVREGPIDLYGSGTTFVPMIDGEPLVLTGGRPTRSTAASHGVLPTTITLLLEATHGRVSGRPDQPAGAWLTISTYEERTAEVHHTYHQQGPLWEPVDLRRGPLRGFHSFYVERDGALLAYQRWSADFEQDRFGEWDESPKAGRFRARVEAALEKTPTEFVQLSGPPVARPLVPDDVNPWSCLAGTDGTLYALAAPHQYDSPEVVLVWPPGATLAQTIALPELTGYGSVELGIAGEHAFVHGREGGTAYLAMGKGSEWQRISVEEADRSSRSHQISGAARAPDGTLWIAFDMEIEDGEEHPVWRKPEGDAWKPVPLPALDRAWFPSEPQWGLQNGDEADEGALAKVPRMSTLDAAAPHVRQLRWADDAVWVLLDAGEAYADGALGSPRRTVLLTTSAAAGSEPPVVLPSTLALYLERHNQARQNDVPGAKSCQHPALVLGPASLVEDQPDAVKALEEHAPTHATAPGIERTYVGELDGTRVLVGLARARTPAQAKTLVTALKKATGLEVTASCRVPTVERMLE